MEVFGGILLYEGSDRETRFSLEDLRLVEFFFLGGGLGVCGGVSSLSLVRMKQNSSADHLSATVQLMNAFKAALSARRRSLF